jgi:hypothetical protein
MAESRRPLATHPDAELEQALTALGREVAFPPTPDVSSSVRERLAERPPMAPARQRRRLYWLAAAALLAMVIGALALFPQVRTAIADRLGLRGVAIHWLEGAPTPAPSPVGSSLQLGREVSLDEARSAVAFPVYLPRDQRLSESPAIYLLDEAPGAMVSLVYPAGPDLPAAAVPGVGALLTEFRGETNRNIIEKGLAGSDSGATTHLEAVTVDGEPGFWITGAPHAVFFVCYNVGECRQERYRLAGNVLLWQKGEVTLRLESSLTKAESLAIAESVRR